MRQLISTGLVQAVRNLHGEFRIWLRHIRGVRHARNIIDTAPCKLHLGCGPNYKDGWLNVDLFGVADINLDLREPLPFPDARFALVYTEHFLEHVDYPQATLRFLGECFRVLRSGGTIRIGVPDTEWPLFEYTNLRNEDYFLTAKKEWHPAWCITEMEHINYHFRQDGEHRFAYDYLTLQQVLRASGFIDINRVMFDPAIDSESRKTGTLYVTAIKP